MLLDFWRSVKEEAPAGTFVDIGSGDGQKLKEIFKSGILVAGDKVIALDISAPRMARLKAVIPTLETRIDDATTLASLPDGYCDAIAAAALIEHLEDMEGFLRNVRRALRPGGKVYISSLVRRKWAVWYYRNRRGEFVKDPEHHYEWRSNEEFTEAIGRHFKIEGFHASNYYLPLSYTPLLLRRLGCLNDSQTSRLVSFLEPKLRWACLKDPFWHRVEVVARKE